MKKIILILLVACFNLYSSNSLCSEGKWCTFEHESANANNLNNSKEKIFTKISITKSTYKITDNWIRLIVYYSVENNNKKPMVFSWKNKYLKDQDGAVFFPTIGIDSKQLQPYEKFDDSYIEYSLPKNVDIGKLTWGLYNEFKNQMLYEIKISPKMETKL